MVSATYASWLKTRGATDTTQLRPFAQSLPPALVVDATGGQAVTVRLEPQQHASHPDLPATPVWAYTVPDREMRDGDRLRPVLLEATGGCEVQVTWENRLGAAGSLVLHPFIDLGVHMSAAQGHYAMSPYAVGSSVSHLHGARVEWTSDGHPVRVPGGDVTVFAMGEDKVCRYPNRQPGTTLWFHDHLMGSTAANVYAGLAGMYLIRCASRENGGEDPVDEAALGLPDAQHELPLIVGDRSFAHDGRLLYGATFSALPPESIPPDRPGHTSDQASEFKGDCICVNGVVWPYILVEPTRYRLRLLNASTSRFYKFALHHQTTETPDDPRTPQDVVIDDHAAPVQLLQIGGDGGFLPEPYSTLDGPRGIVLAPGERADVLVDFTQCPAGTRLLLTNDVGVQSDVGATSLEGNGGDAVFGGPQPAPQRLVAQFRLVPADPAHDHPTGPAAAFTPPAGADDGITALRAAVADVLAPTRSLVLTEVDQGDDPAWPQIQRPGDLMLTWYVPRSTPLPPPWSPWGYEVTTTGDTEVWELTNVSPDTHPIHLHLVQFLLLARTQLPGTTDATPWSRDPDGLDANERGWKDTIRVGTGQVTRFAVRFDGAEGRFVWHCHILEHEDMGMMRPLLVLPRPHGGPRS